MYRANRVYQTAPLLLGAIHDGCRKITTGKYLSNESKSLNINALGEKHQSTKQKLLCNSPRNNETRIIRSKDLRVRKRRETFTALL